MTGEEWRLLDKKNARPREVCAAIGKAKLDYRLFMMTVDDLDTKPPGLPWQWKPPSFDEGSVQGRLQRVEAGLYTFIGAVWLEAFGKEAMSSWLSMIYEPLVKTARDAYPELIQIHGPKASPIPTTAAGKRVAAALGLLRNLKNLDSSDIQPKPNRDETFPHTRVSCSAMPGSIKAGHQESGQFDGLPSPSFLVCAILRRCGTALSGLYDESVDSLELERRDGAITGEGLVPVFELKKPSMLKGIYKAYAPFRFSQLQIQDFMFETSSDRFTYKATR
ncbi:hypothetical protein C8R44DRAFT_738557 [Mycena epipterygia]|nr:hypothetical protein C8R44DRAFT_738557 [Mycena epipterygia]